MARDDEWDDREEPTRPRGQTLDDIRRALREEYRQTVSQLGPGRRRVLLDRDDEEEDEPDEDEGFGSRWKKRRTTGDSQPWYRPAFWPAVVAVVLLAFGLGYVTGAGRTRFAREAAVDDRVASTAVPSASPPGVAEPVNPPSAAAPSATETPQRAKDARPPQEASAREATTGSPDANARQDVTAKAGEGDAKRAADAGAKADRAEVPPAEARAAAERAPRGSAQGADDTARERRQDARLPDRDTRSAEREARADRADRDAAADRTEGAAARSKRSTERVRRDTTPPADSAPRERRGETVASVTSATRGGDAAAESAAEDRDLPPRQAGSAVARADDTRADARSGTPSGVALRIAVSEWIVAHRMADLDRLMALYAPKLAVFGSGQDVGRDTVRRDKQRAFAARETLVSAEPTVTVSPGERTASSRLTLRYVTGGSRPTSGQVVRELGWVWTAGGWKIESEQDVAVLR
jgi:hypothetical protein